MWSTAASGSLLACSCDYVYYQHYVYTIHYISMFMTVKEWHSVPDPTGEGGILQP